MTTPQTDPCTIERKCSSTGVLCGSNDATCKSDANSRQLEILCTTEDGTSFLYCPSNTGRSDSKAVWVLLFFAVLLAVGGALVARRLFRSSE